jgi:error-prone DNA polymerase
MLEHMQTGRSVSWFCNTCSHDWQIVPPRVRFRSLEDLVARTGVNREELATLAEIGALNTFGYHRREALWQVEKVIRPAGELFEEGTGDREPCDLPDAAVSDAAVADSLRTGGAQGAGGRDARLANPRDGDNWSPGASAPGAPQAHDCPLVPMSPTERLVADYAGTRLTIGPHPMALRRQELSLRGVLRAIDLPRERDGRRIRIAGTVITRQRPGTGKGFVFLTLEDETGIANIIVRPDVFTRDRMAVLEEPFLLIEGRLQNQEGVTSVRAERCEGIAGVPVEIASHDFY